MDSIKLTFTPTRLKKLESVYIVEDSPAEMEMTKDYFSKYPEIQIKGFINGDECLKEIVVSGVSPDMILVDYFLDSQVSSSKDGLEILVKLKELCPNASIIMHTSVDNERVIELARKKGAFNYVVKGASGYEKLDRIIEQQFLTNNPDSKVEEGTNSVE
jgi:response regulator of citrate/malate metabolism